MVTIHPSIKPFLVALEELIPARVRTMNSTFSWKRMTHRHRRY